MQLPGVYLGVAAALLLASPGQGDSSLPSEETVDLETNGTNEPSEDLAKAVFERLFRQRRAEQLEAVRGLLRLDHFERQYKMVALVAEKIFKVVQSSRVTLEGSGYVPGSAFPRDAGVRDALAAILENTALLGEMLLRLPEVTRPLLRAHHDWEVLLLWSIGFAADTRLMDPASVKLLSLVSQELGLEERERDFINPYRKTAPRPTEGPPQASPKRRRSKPKKGPQLSRHSEL